MLTLIYDPSPRKTKKKQLWAGPRVLGQLNDVCEVCHTRTLSSRQLCF